MNRTFYYARVSSCEQNLARQLEAFAKLGAEEREIVADRESSKSLDCPGYVHSFSLRDDERLNNKLCKRVEFWHQ